MSDRRLQLNALAEDLDAAIKTIAASGIDALRCRWREVFGADPAPGMTKDLLARSLAHKLQKSALGGLSARTSRLLRDLGKGVDRPQQAKTGSVIVREHAGVLHEVLVVPGGFCWQGRTFASLSIIAREITGTSWNGPRFFGFRSKAGEGSTKTEAKELQASALKVQTGRRSSLEFGRRPSSEQPTHVHRPPSIAGTGPAARPAKRSRRADAREMLS